VAEIVRRLAALVIALSLVLPQRACVNGDQVVVHYPLSNADSPLAIAVIAGLYLLPIALIFVPGFRVVALVAGIATAGAGLYFIAYGASLAASKLLIGWYAYTLGALAYLGASLVALFSRPVRPGPAAADGELAPRA
jgi:hypothetical protein